MEDEHVIPSENETEGVDRKPVLKKILIIVLAILALLGIGGVSYYWGTRSQEAAQLSPTPTPQEEPTDTPTPTIGVVEGTPSPTKKPTATPTLTPTPVLKTKIFNSTSALDGFRSSNGGGNATLEIRAGRNVNLVSRGFVSFEISTLPAGAKIQEATLRLYQAKIIGNPYGAGGSIKVDHLTYGDSLDDSDYGMAALTSSFVTLSPNAVIEWKDANVTDQFKDDVANARSRSQFRIHYQIETTGADVTGDFAYFEAAENTQNTGNIPQLVVKYY